MSDTMFYELAEKTIALENSGKKIIKLNIGDTNLPAPPCAIEAASDYIKKVKSGYGSSAGMKEFRERIAERENCEVDEVVVGPGSKQLIFALLSVLAKKGDSVNVPSPYWPAYELACKQLGLKFTPVNTKMENNWNFDSFGKSGIGIICNPLNPASTVYQSKTIEKAIEECSYLILDEAYRELAFEKIPYYQNAIRVRSFSKEFNMEGWRLGYIIAPKEIVKKLIAFNQITTTCVAPFIQVAGIACLDNEKEITKSNRTVWSSRLSVAEKELLKIGFKFAKPKAGIYIFATHEKLLDSENYALSLLEKGVAVSPGTAFGNHKKFIRICINQSEQILSEAISNMQM